MSLPPFHTTDAYESSHCYLTSHLPSVHNRPIVLDGTTRSQTPRHKCNRLACRNVLVRIIYSYSHALSACSAACSAACSEFRRGSQESGALDLDESIAGQLVDGNAGAALLTPLLSARFYGAQLFICCILPASRRA